jgi:elongation factor P
MATITTNDLKNGMHLDLNGDLVQVLEFQHVKPGKGGAFVRTSLKNVRTGSTVDKTFRAGEKVDRAMIDKREMQYLYKEGSDFVFMDTESYDQRNITPETLGSAADFIIEGRSATVLLYGSEIVGTDLPPSVELTIAETEPGLQGDRSSGGTKPATLETGRQIQVPLFVNIGDVVKVDTRSGEYLSRA